MPRTTAAEGALGELGRAIEAITRRQPTREMLGRFQKYLELLTSWNRTHHLTSYRTPWEIVRGLFIDSLLFIPVLPPRPMRLVDIGAGPGIPGIPIRIVEPGVEITLVESRRKPVSFLAAVKRELGLADVEVVHGRAGAEAAHPRGQYDCAVVRGVRLDEELRAAALGYLKPGGRLVCGGAPSGSAAAASGPADADVEEVDFPEIGFRRRFVIVRV